LANLDRRCLLSGCKTANMYGAYRHIRLRHIWQNRPTVCVAQSNSAFTRAASLAQLVLALGPSPRPWFATNYSLLKLPAQYAKQAL